MDGRQVRRARRWFWLLTLVAVVAMGVVSTALEAAPGPGTGLTVAVSGVVLVGSTIQAARVWCALSRRPHSPRGSRS